MHADLPEHGCCRITLKPPPPARGWERLHRLWMRARRRPVGEPWNCGQLCGHPGNCAWWTPGDYLILAPPILHPLDPLPGWGSTARRCPGCGRGVSGVELGAALWVVRDGRCAAAYSQPRPGASHEAALRFDPCGCEFRQILPGGC